MQLSPPTLHQTQVRPSRSLRMQQPLKQLCTARNLRRDALPSIQKKSPRFVVPFWLLSGVELVVKHTCVCRDKFGDRRIRRSVLRLHVDPDFQPPSPPQGGDLAVISLFIPMGRRSLAGDGPGRRMRPRRRTALNWRRRRTRRDALPSIQKEESSLRRTVLASVGCRTCRGVAASPPA